MPEYFQYDVFLSHSAKDTATAPSSSKTSPASNSALEDDSENISKTAWNKGIMRFLLSSIQWGLIVGNWWETGLFGQLWATGICAESRQSPALPGVRSAGAVARFEAGRSILPRRGVGASRRKRGREIIL